MENAEFCRSVIINSRIYDYGGRPMSPAPHGQQNCHLRRQPPCFSGAYAPILHSMPKKIFWHNSFFNSNKYGFEGLISAPSALKIFEIHKVFLQIFALTERKSSPSKLFRI
ncbi:MAG: hypothetical protein SPI97_02800 [Oscillospiraceae bacterium]|nr:hypothetical protein [Oscillospiraceae bacterium]